MSTNKWTALLLLAVSFFACQEAEEPKTYAISGTISDYDGYLFLNYTHPGDSTYRVKDSVKVENGRFSFMGEVPYPVQGYLHMQPPSGVAYLYVEPGESEIFLTTASQPSGDETHYMFTSDSIVGSYGDELSDSFQAYRKSIQDNPDYNTLIIDKVAEIVKANPSHPYAGKLLADFTLGPKYLTVARTEELLAVLDKDVQSPDDLMLIDNKIVKDTRYAPGKPIGKIELINTEGELTALDPSQSAYTLVDFWASWCRPCLEKMPEYVELLSNTERKDLMIFGVSIDEDTTAWKAAIEKYELNWQQVADTLGFDSPTAEQFYLLAIPSNILIDSTGTIVEADIKLHDLQARFLK